jgi:MSHA biogenesis protein MshQ
MPNFIEAVAKKRPMRRLLQRIFLILIFQTFVSGTAQAATYTLPGGIGSAPFTSCSFVSGTTYSCSSNVDIGDNNTLNFTANMTLQISGDFVAGNSTAINGNGFSVTISASDDIDLGNTFVGSVNFIAADKFDAGNGASITGNITAGNDVGIGNGGTITGNVIAGDQLDLGTTTVIGSCTPTDPQCSNGCSSSTSGIVTTVTCTSNGTFTPPSGVTLTLVEAWGGGGGGGAATGNPDKGGGGAGGQYAYKTTAVTPGTAYSVVVGSGGAGGSSSAGAAGGDSTFNTNTVVAKGGAGGGYAGTNSGDGPAAAGSVTGGIGDIVYRGGNSTAGNSSGSCNDGGAGGGGAGSGGNGTNAGTPNANSGGAGTATGGGNGGNGSNSSGTGAAGSTFGGGGAGACAESNANQNGGAGGAGRIVITYSGTPTPLADWRMDEASWNGTANEVLDSSGNNNHGRARIAAGATALPTTASGAAAYTAGGNSTCNYGQFDTTSGTTRTNTYVELSNMPTLPNSFTFAAWIRSTNASQSGQRILVRDDADNGWGFSLGDPGAAKVRFFNRNITNSGSVTGDGSNPGCGVFCLDTAAVITSNNWFYVAVAIDTVAKNVTHYVFNQSGTLVSNTSSAFAGTWKDGTGTAAIGGETSASSEGVQSSFHFNGNIDEMQIYSGALSRATIQTLITRARTCPSAGPNHIRAYLDNTTSALTCSPRAISAIACNDSTCTSRYASDASVTLSPGGTAATIPASGTGTPSVAQLTIGAAAVTLSSSTPSASGSPTFRCYSGTVATPGTEITGACNLTFSDAGLFVSVPHHRSCDVQTLSITAAKTDDTTKKCVPAFDAGTSRDIKLRFSYSNPGTGALTPTVGSANPPTTALATGSDQTLSLAFTGGIATTNFRYQDAGSLTITASYSGSVGTGDAGLTMGTVLGNASYLNPFVVAPQNFVLSGIPAAPLVAGSPFNVTVTAKNNCSPAATTQNFAGTVVLSSSNPQPGIGNASAISQSITVSSGGTASANTTWNEVGTIDLSAATTNYLSSGLDVSTTSATSTGRFQPAYLATAVKQQGCSGNSFTYSGQPFQVTVTAYEAGGGITANYAGATWAKSVTLGSDDAGVCTPTTANFSNYTLAATDFTLKTPTLSSADTALVTNISPSPLPISYTQSLGAPSSVVVCAKDSDGVNSHGQAQATIPIRNGRLRIANAFGSEQLALRMAAQTEYYNGSAWATNTDDNCTTFATLNGPTSFTPALGTATPRCFITANTCTSTDGVACNDSAASSKVANGSVALCVTKPGTAGFVDVTFATPPYLQFNGVSPSARASFGLYSNPVKIIDRREFR